MTEQGNAPEGTTVSGQQPPEPDTLARLRPIARIAAIAVSILLAVAYTFLGDRTPLGEALTLWPSFLYLFGFVPLLALGFDSRHRNQSILMLAAILAFLVLTVEWRTLLRREPTPPSPAEGIPLTVVTWNMAHNGDWSAILAELAPLSPDIVFLQETPDGSQSLRADLTTSGPFAGYHWNDAGDCAVLSRHPISAFFSRAVGPWSDPQILVAYLPGGRRLMLVNVRLMHPGTVTGLLGGSRGLRALRDDHPVRLSQNSELARLIEETRLRQRPHDAIVAGDFNMTGGAWSFGPLARAGLREVWPEAGVGWGGTIPAGFPLARIDQMWISGDIGAVSARTLPTSLSDHRPLVARLLLRPDAIEWQPAAGSTPALR